MAKYRIGIVGVGKLGNYHCKALSSLPEVDLVGLFDIDKQRCDEMARLYRCRAFDRYEDMLTEVDAVGVIVPTIYHLDMAKMALMADKSVFVEKPIAGSVAEAREMVDLADKKALVLQVGHIERFNPAIRALGTDLNPRFIESHRLAPFDPRGTDVAVVLDLMIHDIDIILSLVKSDPVHIDANGVAVVSSEIDIANARLLFHNGCVANVTASRISQRKMRKMRLFQRDSYISIDFLQKFSEVFRIVQKDNGVQNTLILGQIDRGEVKRNIIYEKPRVPEEDAMQAEWMSFVDAMIHGTPPIVSGRDGLKALEVATEITQKIADQKPLE
jgi:predicted dehydrogenase